MLKKIFVISLLTLSLIFASNISRGEDFGNINCKGTFTPPSALGGRSITVNGDAVDADAELYTNTKCIYWENPVATDDFKSIWISDGYASTITRIYAESDQTVTLNLQIDDGTPADVATADLVPAVGSQTACASGCDTTIAAGAMASGNRLDMKITSVANIPTWCSVCWTSTKDD